MLNDSRHITPIFTDAEKEFRKSFLKDLPVGSSVKYIGPSTIVLSLSWYSFVKVSDSTRKMTVRATGDCVLIDKHRLFYENLTCDELDNHEEVTRKLINKNQFVCPVDATNDSE